MGPVNDYLVAYLTSIDEQLLFYLDQDDEMMVDTVERLRESTRALLAGSVTPAALNADWPDWFILAPAFVLTYGTEELEKWQDAAVFLRVPGDVGLTEADETYLRALERQLGVHLESRASSG